MSIELHQTIADWDAYYDIYTKMHKDNQPNKLGLTEKIIGITHKTVMHERHTLTLPVFIIGKQRDCVVDQLEKELDLQKLKTIQAENLVEVQVKAKKEAQAKIKSIENSHGDMKMNMIKYREERDRYRKFSDELLLKLDEVKQAIGSLEFEKITGSLPSYKPYSPGSINPKMEHVPVE